VTDLGEDEYSRRRDRERVKTAERTAFSAMIADGFIDDWNRSRHLLCIIEHWPKQQCCIGCFHIAIEKVHETRAGPE
jgi:hypothetical protein